MKIEELIDGKPRPEHITRNDFLSTIGQIHCSVTQSEEDALEKWRKDNAEPSKKARFDQ